MKCLNRKYSNIIKKGACALGLTSLVLCCLFTAACGRNEPLPPEQIVSVDTPAPSAAPETTQAPTPAPTPALYSLVSLDNSMLGDGEYVLVNYEHGYAHTLQVQDRVKQIEKTRALLLAKSDAELLPEVISALQAFADGFYEATGGDRLLVTSAYRTESYQRELYDDYVKQHGEEMARIYVADPGKSEHHTGLAVDLSTMTRDGQRVPLIEHERFPWVTEHCADYGFILRYPVGSEETTRVAYEPWHFRYLGSANAHACTALKMVYEDYIEHLKVYTVENGMLHLDFTEDGKVEVNVAYLNDLPDTGYLIYFVPASEDGATAIPIPLACGEYKISGNNEDGFIVTAPIGNAADDGY